MPIEPGLVFELTRVVTESETAAAVAGGKLPHVLSTPHLVGWIETTCHQAIDEWLGPDQTSVGISINLKHMAATPVGMEVRVRVEVLEVSGRKLRYRVEAWDPVEKAAEGEHERFIIDCERFTQNVEKKVQKAASK
jgi:fluoroacetyl-CoA thioesterase